MEITVTLVGDTIAVMKPKGEVNASNFVELVDKAREIYKNPASNLILDLGEVPSISTTGQVAIHKVALIFSGMDQEVGEGENPDFTHSSNARKFVKLLNLQPEVRSSLEKGGFTLFFKLYDDLDSAVASFGA